MSVALNAMFLHEFLCDQVCKGEAGQDEKPIGDISCYASFKPMRSNF